MGLGKTHLMHAIGNQVIAKFPRKRVVYATSEKFTNEFITSIQQGKIDEFRARYRRIDLLLIDDIQFIADKERTQEEFFHTFNAIHEDGKQIVMSSDRPPKAILTLEERLRSRFEWGLIADLTAPDLETRIAILRAKAEEGALPITSDVIEFIARKVVSNIRELEGALNRIVAYASMGATPISIELAQAVLSNVLYNPKKRQVTPERIAKAVSDYYSVPLDVLQGQKRDKSIVMPRQIAMFLMREETDVSLLRIGAELGGRDHSTVLHACDKITREVGGQRRAAARDRRRPRAHLRRLSAAPTRSAASRRRRQRTRPGARGSPASIAWPRPTTMRSPIRGSPTRPPGRSSSARCGTASATSAVGASRTSGAGRASSCVDASSSAPRASGSSPHRACATAASRKVPDAAILDGHLAAIPLDDASVDAAIATYVVSHLSGDRAAGRDRRIAPRRRWRWADRARRRPASASGGPAARPRRAGGRGTGRPDRVVRARVRSRRRGLAGRFERDRTDGRA